MITVSSQAVIPNPPEALIAQLEDDLVIKQSGWRDFYIEAYEKSNIHHFLFCPAWHFGPAKSLSNFQDIVVGHPQHDGGVFAFYTRKVIEVCGGYHPDFRDYGWGHCEFTERIHRAGLSGKYKINHLVGSEEFLDFVHEDSARLISPEDREKEGDINQSIWQRCREKGLIKVDLPDMDYED